MTDQEFIIPPLGGEGTKVSITRGRETTLLTEGVDYDINDQEVTFREGVVSPLPDSTTTTKSTQIVSDWDLQSFFMQMRFDKNHHLGLGDIRLTAGQQDEIIELVDKFYQKRKL